MITFSPLYKTLARKKMTLSNLAEKMWIKHGSLHNILTGEHTTVRQVEKICNVLDCKIEEVIEDDGQCEAGWESVLREINRERDSDDYRLQGFEQDHPWLRGFDIEAARKVLFVV